MVEDRSRIETLPLIGGHPVLDLVNTVSWRGVSSRRIDHLRTVEDCLIWATRAGVVTASEADRLKSTASREEAAAAMVDDLRAFRATVEAFLAVRTPHLPDEIKTPLLDALAHAELTAGADGSYQWICTELDPATILRRLALALMELMQTGGLQHVGCCADEECRWVFLDTSRGHRRRWCDSNDCGNRHRVRAHHQRHQAAQLHRV